MSWARETVRQMGEEFRASVRREAVRWAGLAGVTMIAGITTVAVTQPALVESLVERMDGDTTRVPVVVIESPAGLEFIPTAASSPVALPASATQSGGGGGVSPDMYKPSAWNDTVHFEDFSGMVLSDSLNCGTGNGCQINYPFAPSDSAYTYVKTWDDGDAGCSGAQRASGYSVGCKLLDSMDIGNQVSPPWVWEHHYPTNSGGLIIWFLDFALGNGTAAANNLTRVYFRYSIFFEGDGVGFGTEDYTWNNSSHKWFSWNQTDNAYFESWYGGGPVYHQNTTSPSNPCVQLYSNTWIDYYPGDTVGNQSGGGNGTCVDMGLMGGRTTGVWQHYWFCMDFSQSAGQRVVSWGLVDENQNGIGGYWDDLTTWQDGSTDFDGFYWNGTWGGLPKTHAEFSHWIDDFIVMTGSSGSCQVPPSFS